MNCQVKYQVSKVSRKTLYLKMLLQKQMYFAYFASHTLVNTSKSKKMVKNVQKNALLNGTI